MKRTEENIKLNKKIDIFLDQTVNSSHSSLKKVVRGTFIIIIGTIVALPLNILTKVILARYFTPSEYGIFNLGFSIVSILVVFSLLGLSIGSTRQIAYYKEKRNFSQVQSIINSSIRISLITSLIISIILVLISDFLSMNIFHDPALSMPLKIFSVSIPFITMTTVLVAIYKGFYRVEEQVYFLDILRNILFSLFLLLVISFAFSFQYAVIAFSISYIVTLILLIIYSKKRLQFSLIIKREIRPLAPIYKDLLLFSLPLLFIDLFQMIITWTDTLILGGMVSLNEVGLYNAAHPISNFVSISMAALLPIYAPIMTGFFAKGAMTEIRTTYSILTKWVFLTSLPLFLLIFLIPQVFLNFLFGNEYISAGLALQVLALGMFISNLLGPNGTTLVAIGKSRFLMWASFTSALMNVILNLAFIPSMGMVGASLATSISIVFHCIIRHMKVHSILKVKPITKNLLKPTILSVPIILFIWFIIINYFIITLWMIFLLFVLFVIVIILIVIITKSLDQEDIMMILEIEKRMGINLSLLKKIMKKFL